MLYLPLSFYHNHKQLLQKCCKKTQDKQQNEQPQTQEKITPQPKEQEQQQKEKKQIPEQFKPIILTGPSGTGKGTAISYLMKQYPDVFELSISSTTRQPRQNEKHGVDYYFVTMEEFKQEIEENSFAEWCEVHAKYYGTHLGKLYDISKKNKIPLLDIDVQGGEKIHKQFPNWNYCSILAPSIEIQEARLRGRQTDSEEQIQRRLKNAVGEIERLKELDYYHEIVNDELEHFHSQLSERVEQLYPQLKKN